MKARRLRSSMLLTAVVLLVTLSSACSLWPPRVKVEPPEDLNILVNPTFEGAEDEIPPPGWLLYGSLDDNRRVSFVNAGDPERRALLIEDDADVAGKDGEIGLQQTVSAGPGAYRAEMEVRPVAPGRVSFQIRFLPSEISQTVNVFMEQLDPDRFETIAVEAVAPPGTTHVRIYLFTTQSGIDGTPSLEVRSIRLIPLTALTGTANLLANPTFGGAEVRMPPPGWSVYGGLDANRRITVVNSGDPARRALLIEDDADLSGLAGEIGLQQNVNVLPGKFRAEVEILPLEPGQVSLQIRFMPSEERAVKSVLMEDLTPGVFQTVSVEGEAPPDTTYIRVYLYTAQSGDRGTPSFQVRSVKLFRLPD